jgi:hypothetical protein
MMNPVFSLPYFRLLVLFCLFILMSISGKTTQRLEPLYAAVGTRCTSTIAYGYWQPGIMNRVTSQDIVQMDLTVVSMNVNCGSMPCIASMIRNI